MRSIAIFDYKIINTNPAGGCHRRLLADLCDEFEFTVFSVEFDNPCHDRIKWIRIPAPTRPLFLLFLIYHLLAPCAFILYRLVKKYQCDCIQFVESNMLFGDISYTHFCHRAYLNKSGYYKKLFSLSGCFRLFDHWLHALLEPFVFRRVKYIVVPSQGLCREIQELYPFTRGKIVLIPNAIDKDKMVRPTNFDRDYFRSNQGVGAKSLVLVFVALGHFERKGLTHVLHALAQLKDNKIVLWVVGGEEKTLTDWKKLVSSLDLKKSVIFWGMQQDIRPFLWGADSFILPSEYETFSLATFEAAAAGLPLIVTNFYGWQDHMVDGVTGYIIDRSLNGILDGLRKFQKLSDDERHRMGQNACATVNKYDSTRFIESWRKLYVD